MSVNLCHGRPPARLSSLFPVLITKVEYRSQTPVLSYIKSKFIDLLIKMKRKTRKASISVFAPLLGALLATGCADKGELNKMTSNILRNVPIGKLSNKDASVEYLRAICPANKAFGELTSAMISVDSGPYPDEKLKAVAQKAIDANNESKRQLESLADKWPIDSREYIEQIIDQQELESKALGQYVSPLNYQLDAISRNAYTGSSQALTTEELKVKLRQINEKYNPRPSVVVRMKLDISNINC